MTWEIRLFTRPSFYVIKQKLIFRAFLFLVSVIGFGYTGVFLFEYGKNESIQSPFDILYFLFITMTTVGYGDISPQSMGGKMVVIVIASSTVILIALFSAITAAVLIESKIREEVGMGSFHLKNHIVIIGWNFKGPKIVDLIHREGLFQSKKMVVVANLDKKPLSSPFTHYIKSESTVHVSDLQRAAIESAEAIFLLADYGKKEGADALTSVNCMLARHLNPEAAIIAELLNPTAREYLEISGATHIIGVGEIGGALLAESYLGREDFTTFLDKVA
ncbi:MAG: ion channel [Thermodesulfobacteriota bacterium]